MPGAPVSTIQFPFQAVSVAISWINKTRGNQLHLHLDTGRMFEAGINQTGTFIDTGETVTIQKWWSFQKGDNDLLCGSIHPDRLEGLQHDFQHAHVFC